MTILRLAILSISITQDCQPPYIDMVINNANVTTEEEKDVKEVVDFFNL